MNESLVSKITETIGVLIIFLDTQADLNRFCFSTPLILYVTDSMINHQSETPLTTNHKSAGKSQRSLELINHK